MAPTPTLLSAALALAAAACAAAFDEDTSILMFRDFDFVGKSAEIGAEARAFPPTFNDRISSCVVKGNSWLLYTDFDFQGQVSVLPPGDYARPEDMGIPNDKLSSVRPFPPPSPSSVLLFEDAGFRGRMVHVTGVTTDLSFIGFNNKASSAIVLSGTWRLYQDAGLSGPFIDLEEGEYPVAGGDNLLSSIEPM